MLNPDAYIPEVQMNSIRERERVNEYRRLVSEVPCSLLHERFEMMAGKCPEAPAVFCADRVLSYSEVEAQANQLAHYLCSLGVRAEKSVGVFLPRCLETAIVVLGISKSGGVYLPLDPELPMQRVSLLVESASPAVVITSSDLALKLPVSLGAKLVIIDKDWPGIQSQPRSQLQAKVRGVNLAYIIYTSGSTGVPKGVGVPHAAIARHLDAVGRTFGYEPKDRALLFASLSFDVSIEQLLAPLAAGAAIVVRGAEAWSARECREQLKRFGVTIINVTPGYWREIADEIGNALPELRLVIVGGDVMPADTAERWLASSSERIELLNAYGPTEGVITTTVCRVSANSISPRYGIPIGCALPGRTTQILDPRRQPVPRMVWGELCLGGDVMARGYVDDPALTAELFTPDDSATEPGRRIYRTGDIARFRDDDSIEFLGRADSQVKIRGFRIELGEIEAALRAHPAVLEAAVAVQETEGRKRLAGYVIPRNSGVDLELIRGHLQKHLPDYMVPSSLMVLSSMPFTHSGKIDRKALPAPPAEMETGHWHGTVESQMESQLAEIWAKALNVAQVGPDDDFFELGGDSLTAMSMTPNIEAALGMEIPMRALFDAPTVRQLARFVEKLKKPKESNGRPVFRRVARTPEGEFPLMFSQQSLFTLDQLRSQAGFYNVSGGVRFLGRLDYQALQMTLTELVRRHEALRTVFHSNGSSPVQRVQQAATVDLDLVDLSTQDTVHAETMLQSLTQEEAERPIDLKRGPILRAKLFTLAPEDHVLWLTTHHIVSDAHSVSLILRELCVLYDAYSHGLVSPLAEPQFQLVDYACWQCEWLCEETLAPHLAYWRRQLSACPMPVRFPMEREDGVPDRQGATSERTIYGEIPGRLQKFCQTHSVTAFMTLLAVWKAFLFSCCQEKDVVVGTVVLNRRQRETESMVGFLANVLVLRTDLGGDPSFSELVARIKNTVLQAFDHECVPFERLVEELRPNYAAGETPLFKTFFTMPPPLVFPSTSELQMCLIQPEDRSAKFDLTLFTTVTENEIRLAINYAKSRFTAETVTRMIAELETFLEVVLSDHELRLSALILEVQRRNREKWNALREGSLRRLLAGSPR